ncbi:MAG: hypothetical protein H6R18_485 [Proteobacteria bacterium]|nr:hypothetical protein [Pseudomonadota bacterium]
MICESWQLGKSQIHVRPDDRAEPPAKGVVDLSSQVRITATP